MGIAVLLVFIATCGKQANISRRMKQTFDCFAACRSPPQMPPNIKPFELEDLIVDNNYATIVRSPKSKRHNDTTPTAPVPVSTPTIKYVPCQTTDNSKEESTPQTDPKLLMKKFKDMDGAYKYKCKLCDLIYDTYGEVKTHIEDIHPK